MSIVNFAPAFSPDEARRIVKDLYGLRGAVEPLPSERDQNFLITLASGKRCVLKIANSTEEYGMLDAQNQLMEHAAMREQLLPQVIPSQRGANIEIIPMANGHSLYVRLVTYLPGKPMGDVKRHSPELLFDLGQKLARLDLVLQGFDHPAVHREFYWDFANGMKIIKKNLNLVREEKLRRMVKTLAETAEEITMPLLPGLRKSIIYNDANDFNILLGGGVDIYSKDQEVTGFIDLGDIVYGAMVGDLAIAIAYAILGKPQPLESAAGIIRGYHSTLPLLEEELASLFGLIAMRLCMSVCIAAEQQTNQPENGYLGVSQTHIRNTLPKLITIHPHFAEAIFREACGLPPFAKSSKTLEWLEKNARSFESILPWKFSKEQVSVLDLSIGSPVLHGDPSENSEPLLTRRINEAIRKADAIIGVGQYAEARYLYGSRVFATSQSPSDEIRTIHLGMDLFVEAGTPVHAPLDGRVAALAENASMQDYGSVVVLEHKVDGEYKFYTLYGHVDRKSIRKLRVGRKISKGRKIAKVGAAEVNDGTTPHLHFQIINDLLDHGSKFPWSARPRERDVWLNLCPDPNLILRIPEDVFPKQALTKAETLAKRRQKLGGNLSIAYRSPVKILRGWMQYLYDDEGQKYIDAYNNVAHVGHCHPKVVEAARQQIGILNTNTRYLHDNINRYAERLTSLLPDGLDVCYFVNSASEANELALRLARAYTSERDMVVLEAAYHGNTTSMVDISPYKHNGPGGKGAPEWVHAVPIPDVFRGVYRSDDPMAGPKYAAHVKLAIDELKSEGRGLAGFIAESLPSVAGQLILPDGYLLEVYKHVRESGGLCIADEVQTGFGRVGSHFWGFEMQDVVPDIVVLGKPIGNGHPLAAVITSHEVAAAFNNGMEYFTTFGGNPVSCAVGLAVLDVLQEEGLQEHAAEVGNILLHGLTSFVGKYRMVADARGAGLFLGVELIRDLSTLEPAAAEANFIADRMREHGILLGTDGPYHNVVKIRPPMPFNKSDADYLLAAFEKILNEDFSD